MKFQVFILLFSIFIFERVTINAQTEGWCGESYQGINPPYNPDSLLMDLNQQQLQNPTATCSAGYFKLSFYNVNQSLQPRICQVFDDVSNMVIRRINHNECGDLIPQKMIFIDIVSDPSLNDKLALAHSEYDNPPSNCRSTVINRVYQKINGGTDDKFTGPLDGTIYLNPLGNVRIWNLTSDNWDNDPNTIEYDLYSVIFHEILHLLGFTSLYDSSDRLTLYDRYLNVAEPYNPSGPTGNTIPIFLSNCQQNCWTMNPLVGNFNSILSNQCNSNKDIVIGSNAIAPIYGKNTAGIAHLDRSCHSGMNIPVDYLMFPYFVDKEVRSITNAEIEILCLLGYEIDGHILNSTLTSCDGCYVVPYSDLNSTQFESYADCCAKEFFTCVNKPIFIAFDNLLCNDAHKENQSIELTDMFIYDQPNVNDLVDVDIQMVNGGYELTPHSKGQYFVYYTATGCDCKQINSFIQIEAGTCLECHDPPCINLSCINGFENFSDDENYTILYALGGYYIYDNSSQNSPDICIVAGNKFLNLAAYSINLEGITLPLQEPVPPGCKLTVQLKASAKNIPGILHVTASENYPCLLKDGIRNNIGLTLTDCGAIKYEPNFVGDLSINNITQFSGTTCPPQVDLLSYSVSITNNGLKAWKYVSIAPEINESQIWVDDIVITKDCIEADFSYINCPNVHFTASPNRPNMTYSWAFGDNNYGNGQSVNHTYNQNGTYTITLTVKDECDNTKVVTHSVVIDCITAPICACQNNNCIQIGSPGTTTLVWDGIRTLANFTSGCYNVCGVLDVNQNFTINSATLNMSSGAEIIVRPGITLTISSSTLLGCTTMWKGITLEGTAHIDIKDNWIYDAQYAIKCMGNVTFDNAISNHFWNNYVSIYSPVGGFKFISTPMFVNNSFEFDAFKAFYQNQTPVPQTRPFAGIEINNSAFVITQAANTFNNLQNGVVARNSLAAIYNCDMTNIIREGSPSPEADCKGLYRTADGIGIYFNNCLGWTDDNVITNSTCGILADASYLDARNNLINICNDGIYSIRCNTDYQIMIHNTIYDFHYRGISVVDPQYSGVSPMITNNDIYSGLAYELVDGCRGPKAIILRHVQSRTLAQIESNDPIIINGNAAGIYLELCTNIGIQSNVIDYNTLSNHWSPPGITVTWKGYTGITLNGSNSCQIYSNHVTGYNIADRNVQAYHSQSSQFNKYCCNESDNTNVGFEFHGGCNPTGFFTSIIRNHKDGLFLDRYAEIGLQVDFPKIGRGNQWMNASSLNGFNAYNVNATNSSYLQNSLFKVGSCPSSFWPLNIYPDQVICADLTDDWFNDTDPSVACANNNDCAPIVFQRLQGPTGEFSDIDLNDEFISRRTDENTVLGWESRENLMYRLLINSNLIGQNTIIDSFYYASIETNLEKYSKVERSIKNALYYNTEYRQALDTNLNSILIRIANCKVLDSLYSQANSQEDSTAINTQKIAIFANMNSHYQNAINTINCALQQNSNELTLASYQNDSLNPINVFQQNIKQVNAIYLSTIARGIDTFTTTQAAILYNIAHQCPYTGGKSVYFARSLYDNIEVLFYNDSLLCQESEPLILNTSNKSNSLVELFPNPTNGELNLLFKKVPESNQISVEVFNLMGERVIFESKYFMPLERRFSINMNGVPNGMYQFKISSGRKLIHFQNIVIIK